MSTLNPLQNPFAFREATIRTAIGADGEAWFCAKDVFEALGITWSGASTSLKNTPENWQGVLYLTTPGGTQEAIFISEGAVYQTAFRSNKPEAQAFAEWVCGEVLPAIRRQGFYGRIDGKDRIALSKHIVEVAAKLAATKDAMLFGFLSGELRTLCNLAGMAMPDLRDIGRDARQLPLFQKEI